MASEDLRSSISNNALDFAKSNCRIEKSVRQYIEFINSINNGYYRSEGFIEDVAQNIVELGINEIDNKLINEISREISELLIV
jgi:hypothetical protein